MYNGVVCSCHAVSDVACHLGQQHNVDLRVIESASVNNPHLRGIWILQAKSRS